MATRVIDRLVTEVLFRGGVAQLTRIEGKLASTRAELDKFSRATAKIGALFVAATTPIIRRNLQVSQATQRFASITGATADEVKRVREEALRVGADLPLMTGAIIQGQEAWARLGNTQQSTLDITERLAQASVASGAPMSQIAKIVNAAKLQFQLTNDQVNLLLDQLTRIEAISPGTLLSVGEAFRFSGQGAADAGIKIEEYIALLGVGAGSGRAPGEFSRGLTQAFTRISRALAGHGRSSKLITESFGLIGFDLAEVRQILGQDQGFATLFEEIGKRTANTDQYITKAALGSIFGVEYVDVFTFLARQPAKIAKSITEVANAHGEAKRQADEMMKGLYGAWERFKALLDTIFVRLGEAGLDASFENLTRNIGDFMEKLLQVDAAGELVYARTLRGVVTVLKLGSSMLFAAAAAKTLSFMLGILQGVVKTLGFVVGGAGKAVAVFGFILRSLLHPFRTLGGFFATLGTRLGLWAVALAPFVKLLLPIAAIALIIWAAWKPISTFFQGLWQTLRQGAGDVVAAFGRLWDAMKPIGNAIKRAFGFEGDATGEGQAFGEWIINALVTIIDAITAFVEWLEGLTLTKVGLGLIKALGNGIRKGAGYVIEAVKSVWDKVTDYLPSSDARKGPLRNLTQHGKDLVRTFARGVQSAGGIEAVMAGGGGLIPAATVGPPPIRPVAASQGNVYQIGPTTIQVIGSNGSPAEIAREVDLLWNRRMREAVEQADNPVAS